jgi:ribonuclease R
VIPMLPEHLSNHLCSLMPDVERLAFVCDMRVGKTGMPGRAHFYEAVIRSHARLTYDQAWRFLANPADTSDAALTPDVRASLKELHAVYGALKEARDARGALDFRGGEVKARIGEDGKIEGFYAVLRNDAHRLIEECMIAANVQAATALRLAKAKSLYRVHGQPEEKRVTELMKVMNALKIGATFSEQPTPREFRQLVERVAARPDGALLEGLVIRALAQAVYQQTNIGHFGLALEEYAHFTSPIRRYPDLLVHRAIKAALVPSSASGHRYSTAELQALGAESSERERRADDASRDVMGYLKCLYLQPRVGESFEATVTSALEFGLFVQLKEMPIDGLVHISNIPGDYWELDSGGMGLVGRRTGRRWRMGDAVQVRLSRVDLMQRQIDFELVETGEAGSAAAGSESRSGAHGSRARDERPRRGGGGGGGGSSRRSSRGGGRGRRG